MAGSTVVWALGAGWAALREWPMGNARAPHTGSEERQHQVLWAAFPLRFVRTSLKRGFSVTFLAK